jgi:hypothetical protein
MIRRPCTILNREVFDESGVDGWEQQYKIPGTLWQGVRRTGYDHTDDNIAQTYVPQNRTTVVVY